MTAPLASSSSRLRLTMLLVIVGCLFVALVARLWFLQVVNVSAGSAEVIADSYETAYIPAPRGEILDREGQVLVGNRQVPVIEVEQQEASDPKVVTGLADLVGTTNKKMKAAILNNQYEGYAPVPVYSPASYAQILYIDEHQSLFPGVTATTEDEPYATTLGIDAGDVVGYVGQIDASELKAFQKAYPSKHYEAGDVIGVAGIEAEYQQELNGTPGVERIQVDASGREVAVASYKPPVPGDNVVLTLDGADQQVADGSITQGQAVARSQPADTGVGNYTSPGGSAVVENPNNGQILALASEPFENVNQYDQGITPAELKADGTLANDQLDLAIQGLYAPGSTFKLATATAGLGDGELTPDTYFDDTGEITVDGHTFTDDDDEGAGEIDLSEALTVSSDNFFNVIGEDLWDGRATYGSLALQKAAYSYGFGKPTGIDLPGGNSNAGLIPTPAQQVTEAKENPGDPDDLGYWVVGDSIEMAIGQFQVEVSPLQLADAYATFANGGTRYKPQIVLEITTSSGKVIKRNRSTVEGHSQSLSAADRDAMVQGYVGVTHADTGPDQGTGAPVFATSNLANDDIAGKTGTAQVQDGQDTSVFTSFGPATNAKYVVDCFMEDSGYGESIAAPIVRRIWDQIEHTSLTPIDYQPVTGSAD